MVQRMTFVLFLLCFFFSCSVDQTIQQSNLENQTANAVEQVEQLLNTYESDSKCIEGSSLNILFPTGLFTKEAKLIVIGSPADIPLAGEYDGRSEIQSYFLSFHKLIKILKVQKQDVLIENTNIMAHFREKGIVRKSSKTFDIEFVYSIQMQGWQILSMMIYYDTNCFKRAFEAKDLIDVEDIKNPENPLYDPTDKTDLRPIVLQGYDAFYFHPNIDMLLSILDPQIYWIFKGDTSLTPYAGLYHGTPEFFQFLYKISTNFIPQNIQLTGSVQQGNRIDFTMIEDGYSIPTGKTYHIYVLHSFLFKAGKCIEFKTYNDTYAVAQSYMP